MAAAQNSMAEEEAVAESPEREDAADVSSGAPFITCRVSSRAPELGGDWMYLFHACRQTLPLALSSKHETTVLLPYYAVTCHLTGFVFSDPEALAIDLQGIKSFVDGMIPPHC